MNLINLDIKMLRSLHTVAETGNITETARRLGRTQPAITLQLQRLDEICGFNLFRNDGRRMVLTPDGTLVLSYAKSILRLHDELLSRLASPDIEGRSFSERLIFMHLSCCLRSWRCFGGHFHVFRSSSSVPSPLRSCISCTRARWMWRW